MSRLLTAAVCLFVCACGGSKPPQTAVDAGHRVTLDAGTPDAGAMGCTGAPEGAAAWSNWPMPGSESPSSPDPHPIKYTVGPNSVVDTVTGLEWERNASPATHLLVWGQARNYCANLNLNGKSDWRLPTRVELTSLLDYEASTAFDTAAFPNADQQGQPTCGYWTSSPHAKVCGQRYVVFCDGNISAHHPTTEQQFVRCVRQP